MELLAKAVELDPENTEFQERLEEYRKAKPEPAEETENADDDAKPGSEPQAEEPEDAPKAA